MKNKSIWDTKKKKYPKLNKDIEIDVLIIGGGITGISTLYHLIGKNLKVCLVERNKLCMGVTSKTTGKLTYLQDNIYSKLKLYHGYDKTKLYLESQIYAIKLVKNIIKKENIECNLEKVSSYIFSNNKYKLNKEKKLLKSFGIDIKTSNKLPNNYKTNALYVNDTYVFHPLKYLYKLSEICYQNKLDIYENTNIISIKKCNDYYICKTDNNTIKTKYVVCAMHYPYFTIPFFTPLKSWLEKSYIKAYKVDNNKLYSSINIDSNTISTRYYEDNDIYKLYLTNSHNLAFKNNDINNFSTLIDDNTLYVWSNKDIITNDLLPYIGKIDNNFLIAFGYNTWGMTNGSLAGEIIKDIILNKKNKYALLFNPNRSINIGKIINTPLILFSNIYSFIKSKFIYKSWYSNVRFEEIDGKKVGIYKDELGIEHIVYNLCPHLKCSLIFNEVEKTWDCPCHGSRFDIDGNVIEGPSNYSITYKKS